MAMGQYLRTLTIIALAHLCALASACGDDEPLISMPKDGLAGFQVTEADAGDSADPAAAAGSQAAADATSGAGTRDNQSAIDPNSDSSDTAMADKPESTIEPDSKTGGDDATGADPALEEEPPRGQAPTFVAQGEPIDSENDSWFYVTFPGTQCRDGSAAGLAVNRHASSAKLMIYLEGGGACFDSTSCLINRASAVQDEPARGIFDRSNPDNPVRDWNYVHVPYCSGDVHAGTRADATVAGVLGLQQFMGRRNLEAFLQRLLPTFPQMEQVLLTGSSAGGFGASTNAELVQSAFGEVPVFMIDDSGPPMSNEFMRGCLLEAWNETWGFDDGFLASCGDYCTDKSNFSVDYTRYLAMSPQSGAMSGLFETTADSVISLFYGLGTTNCPAETVTAEQFRAGLLDFREKIQEVSSDFGTYYVEGTAHTILRSNDFYTTTVDGVSLVDWVKDILNGTRAAHVGP